jgi:recyclin-1
MLSFRMFETNMDEYLDEEVDCIKQKLKAICRTWEQQLGRQDNPSATTFLNASNPDQVKRNVLAGFKDALLLPVTIVPRTVTYGVNAIVSSGSHGLALMNPQKWVVPNAIHVKESDDVKVEDVADVAEKEGTLAPINEKKSESIFDRLQMLISLDTALELIQADRDVLKRVETFVRYPGKCGHKVHETIEEVFILMLKAAGDNHIAPGFRL